MDTLKKNSPADYVIEPADISIQQSESIGQDFATQITGTNSSGENFRGLVLCDGHGNDVAINCLRKTNWQFILESDDEMSLLENNLKNYHTSEQFRENLMQMSGSTCTIIKIFKNRFEFKWVGDSTARLFQDGQPLWKTTNHTFNEHPTERERVMSLSSPPKLQSDYTPKVLNDRSITMVPSYRYLFPRKDGTTNSIAMTRALGHGDDFNCQMETHTIHREVEKNYQIISASDGLWNMVCDEDFINRGDEEKGIQYQTAKQITDLASRRWKQEWIYQMKGHLDYQTSFPADDDIAVIKWSS